ncbi:MAG: hypothetical protein JWM85_887 [Acidimicrobiaceae bacterium]|nr:hypothetical protein [Acidimicrobiaceae bacterium]
MATSFDRSIAVAAAPEAAWKVLLDVSTVASWVPIVEDVQEKTFLEQYIAVLKDQVGPFRLRADLDIRVTELRPLELVRIAASGEDRQVGSRISVDAALQLEAAPDGGSSINVVGTYEVTGRIATLGAGTIRRKADKILEQFFGSAEKALASG